MKEKEAELLWQQGIKRGIMGYRWPPGASPKQLQQLPTNADIPEPFNGCQMTIHDTH